MFRSILKISSIIILILIVVTVLLYWQTTVISDLIKNSLNSELKGIAKIEYSDLSGNLFETIEIKDLTVTLEDSSTIRTNYLNLTYNLSSVLFQPYLIKNIYIDTLQVILNLKPNKLVESKSETFTVDDIPSALDSLINVDALMETLPVLIAKKLEIRNGLFSIPEYNLNIYNINFRGNYSCVSEKFDIKVQKLSGIWREKDLVLRDFQAELNGNRKRITLNKFRLETNDSFLHAKSEINFDEKNWIIFDVEELLINHSDIAKLLVIPEFDTGFVSGSLNIVGTPQKFSGQIYAQGKTRHYKMDSLVLDIDFKDNTIFVRAGKILVNQSLLTFKGSGSRKLSQGSINYRNFDISTLFPDYIKTSLNGYVAFNVKDLNLSNITGSIDILFYQSTLDSIQIDTLKFEMLATNNNFDIIEPSILRFDENSLFAVRGNMSRDFILDAELYTNRNNLAQLLNALNFDTVGGVFDASLTMSGHINDPDLNGFLKLDYMSLNDMHLDTINLDLQLDKIFGQRKGVAHFSIAKGTLDGFDMTEALINITIDSNKIKFDTVRFANNENYISLAGQAQQENDSIYLGLNLFKINYQNYWIENSDSLLINFYPEEIVINQALFNAPGGGILECRGFWDNKLEDLQLGVYAENIQIDPFRQFVDSTIIFGGVLDGELLIVNPLSDPDIESELYGNYLSYNKSPLGTISLQVDYNNGNIYFKNLNLKNNQTQINASGDITLKLNKENGSQKIDFIEETESNLTVSWDYLDLNQYLHVVDIQNYIKGYSSGELKFSGKLSQPLIDISVLSDSLKFEKYKIEDLILNARYEDGYIYLDSLNTEVNNTFIHLNGWQKKEINLTDLDPDFMKAPINLNLYSEDDQIEFLGNFLDQIEKILGDYKTALNIKGTPEKPYIKDGFFELDNGELLLTRIKDPIKGLSIKAKIEDSEMKIEQLTGYSIKEKDFLEKVWGYVTRIFRFLKGDTQPEGQITGSGTLNLKNLLHPHVNLDLDIYEFFVDYFVENTELLLSSKNLNIEGRDTLYISGEINIGGGKYTVDLDKMKKKLYLTSTEINKGKTLAWNLDIKIPENFLITSSALDLTNNFEIEISGDLNAVQEPHSPEMGLTGHVDILSGNYMAFGQRFEIRQGSIDFSNPKRIYPEIEIFAEKETNQYTVELTVNGNLERLQQDLQIRNASGVYLTNLSFYDKLKYLAGSGTSGSGSELVGTGEDVINTSVETALERGAQSITGLDKVEIQNSAGLVDLQSMKLNNGLQDASISVGKYLTSNLYLEYRSRFGEGTIPTPKLSWDAGNQISLAYKINKFWTVESAYAQTLRGNTLINISVGWKTSF